MGESFTVDDAARLIATRTGKTVALRGVRDLSMRIVVLEQWTERRTIEVVPVARAAVLGGPRDLEAELWSLPIQAPAVFRDHLEIVSDPRTGAVRRCPECDGSGRRQCRECGGFGSLTCGGCDGLGRIPQDSKTYRPCALCSSTGRIPCRGCSGGGNPCSTCDTTGSTYTEQRARIQWTTRAHQMPLSRPPTSIEVPKEAPMRERSYEYEGGEFRPTNIAQGDHFRASVFASAAPEIEAIHKLVRQNPAVTHERIVAQRAWVDCVPLWQIDAGTAQEPVTLYAIGRERALLGVEGLRTAPGPIVAVIALGLGVVAILAGSVLR